MTIRELILELAKYDENEQVGIRAACCLHVHGVSQVRRPGDGDIAHGETVVLEAD